MASGGAVAGVYFANGGAGIDMLLVNASTSFDATIAGFVDRAAGHSLHDNQEGPGELFQQRELHARGHRWRMQLLGAYIVSEFVATSGDRGDHPPASTTGAHGQRNAIASPVTSWWRNLYGSSEQGCSCQQWGLPRRMDQATPQQRA